MRLMLKSVANLLFSKVLLVPYLKELVKRLDGYKTFLGILLLILHVISKSGIAGGYGAILQTVISVLVDGQIPMVLDQGDIDVLVSNVLILWGLFDKAKKAFKGVPQVPVLVKEK